MAVRLMFPTYIFHRNMLNAGETRGFSKTYLVLLQTEIDSMRRNDPKVDRYQINIRDGNQMMGVNHLLYFKN
jgi:hypothetical protein